MKSTVLSIVAVAAWPVFCQAQGLAAGSLPTPIVTKNSVETCLNSRYSQHSLSKTVASAQQISNLLWAAGRAPVTGTYRNIHVATPTGRYLYDPLSHSLGRYSNEVASDGGFAIIYDAQLDFDAGVMFMSAMLACVSLGRSTESPVASCPKAGGYPKTRLIFGVQAVNELKTDLAAHCSVAQGQAGWLPDPSMAGENSLEEVLANLKYVSSPFDFAQGGFAQTNLTVQQVSQILWAGYGCTAHVTSNGRAGLTVPSANASYYLSRSIYLVNEDGVRRYQNRDASASPSTKDHRLEQLTAGTGRQRSGGESGGSLPSGDARLSLQSAVNGLPKAPCYIVLCLDSSNVGQEYAQLEAGFAAGNMLIQASAMGLGCHFKPSLTSAEQKSIQAATGIPAAHVPQAIVSIGPIEAPASLEGDANHDNAVDLEDYVILSKCWLSSPSQGQYDARADFNRDGVVNMADLRLLAANWLGTSSTEVLP
ncbi:MAG: nitroreductase family protein [Phycisphaerae bacterium]|nr:nitroreductase family protein [Phycisphaerae bacterium]